MIAHRAPISGIDATHDLVATAGYDNQVVLWSRATKEPLAATVHDHLANQCRFSASGRYLATSSSDYTARLWRVPDMRLVAVYADQDDDVEMTVVSPGEDAVATASRDHRVRVYDLDGALRARLEGHEADVLSVEWVREGKELVTSSDDGTVRRWDAIAGTLIETIDLGDVETDTIAVADDETLLCGNDDGQIIVIGRAGTVRNPAHDAGIKRLTYDASRRLLVSSSYDRTIRLWTLGDDGSLRHVHTADVPSDVWLRSCAFAGDDQLVFGTFGTSYATFHIERREWDLSGVEPTHGVNAVAVVDGAVWTVGDAGIVRRDGEIVARPGSCCNFLTPYAGRVFTGGQLGIVFDATTGEAIHQHRSPLNCGVVVRSGERELLVVGAYTGEGLVFEAHANGRVEHVQTVQLHDNAVKSVAANRDTLFSVCATGAAAFHATSDFSRRALLEDAHDRISNGAAVMPDARFASVARDLKLRLWDGTRAETIDTPHENSIKCVAVDPVTGYVATGGYHGRVAVYDPAGRRWVANVRPTMAGISSITTTGEPGRFLASSYDGRVYPVVAAG